MDKKRIVFGIGITLVVLAVFTASAAADNVVYFDPDPSCAAPGETTAVTLWLDSTDGVAGMNTDIYFDPEVVNITSGTAGDFPTLFGFVNHGNWVRIGGVSPDWLDHDPGHWKLADFTLKANDTCCGTSTLELVETGLFTWTGAHVPDQVWNNGTFNCPCPVPKPDLVITNKSETLAGDGTFTVTYTVMNIGDADACPSNTTTYINSANVLEDPVPTLNASESYTNTVGPFDCPCGQTLNVTVCADNGNVVDESNETNNCEVNIVECPGIPDLVVEKTVTITDGTFIVNYTVTNIGCGPAGESTTCKFVDGELKESQPCPVLASGASHSGTFGPEPCPCGKTLNVTICADNNNTVDESNETNNCEVNTVECPPCPEKPDLEITAIWTEVKVGKKFNTTRIYYNITNKGDAKARRSVSNLTINGVEQKKKDRVDALQPGETLTRVFNYRGTPQNTIMVCADFKDRIAESDETNNCREEPYP